MTASGRSGRARNRRLLILAMAASVVAAAAAIVLIRPEPKPYTPGIEAASSEEITRRLARGLPGDLPAVTFVDAAAESDLRFRHFHGRRSTQLPEDMGSGAAWGDYDGDGDPDLYLVNEDGPLDAPAAEAGRSPARSALFRNDGGRFTDVTEASGAAVRGCGMGAAWGDYDADGDLDLVVTRYGTSVLLRNGGDGTFRDVSTESGIGGPRGFWAGASWGDADGDGDLDLYVAGYVRYRPDPGGAHPKSLQYRALVPSTLNPSSYAPERNLLFRNAGGRFREIARQAGIDNLAGRSLSASWADFDADGRQDLYVANDVSDNAMYRNAGGGRFEDVSHPAWVADYRGAMGLGIGDWDNDADLDIFITHWIAQENALYDNLGKGARFLDIADQVGLGQSSLDFVGWGTGFFDYDNDGRLDLFAVNGGTFQREDDPSLLVPMRNQLFWNAGRERGFFDVGGAAGAAMDVENVGRGGAAADYDGDGDLDLVVAVNGGEARLLRNEGGNARGWLRLVLRGATERFATGAVLRLEAAGGKQMRVIGAGSSYLSQSPPGEAHFGLGEAARVDRLEVLWPSGARQVLTDLPARATVTVHEGQAPAIEPGSAPAPAGREAADPEVAGEKGRRAAVLRFWEMLRQASESMRAGDFGAAARDYAEALRLDPDHEDALYYLGQCLAAQGRQGEAREALTHLLAVNPSSARGQMALGAILAAPRDGAAPDWSGAKQHFMLAHEINKEETGPMVRLGEVCLAQGDADGAGFWLRSALATNPKNLEAAFLGGYLRWSSGDPAAARTTVFDALRAGVPGAPADKVVGEGDRTRAEPPAGGPPGAPQRVVAPPVAQPHGATLFGDLAARVRTRAGPAGPAPGDPAEIDRAYRELGERLKGIRARGEGGPADRAASTEGARPRP